MHRIGGKLTYSNVISTLCLVLLLGGGTAYAASHLGKESIGSRQLKKEAVTPAKLSAASKATLTGPTGQTGPKGSTGLQGPKGDNGEKGDKGEKGQSGTTQIVDIDSGAKSIAANSTGTFTAECPAGDFAVGGGAFDGGNSGAVLYQSGPKPESGTATSWAVSYKAPAGEGVTVFVHVLCAAP